MSNWQGSRISSQWSIAILILVFGSCSVKNAKHQQYLAQGEALYEKNCSNCHQKNGKGLGLLYPPLRSSDYFERNFKSAG